MTHARMPLPAISPVHAAIAAHRAAYDAFQIAPEGEASERAETAYDDASMAVVAVPCTTAPEAMALFRHLAWWVLDVDRRRMMPPPTSPLKSLQHHLKRADKWGHDRRRS